MSRTRRVFSKDFKYKVVLEALKEKETIEVLSKKYELLPNQISLWKAEAIKNISLIFSGEKVVSKKDEIPIEKLYAEIGQLKMENDFLKKKVVVSFPKDREKMIELQHNELSIKRQCELIEINRSTLYYSPKEVSGQDLDILKLIGKLYFSRPFYGYRKVAFWLKEQGYLVNEKRVRRLMKVVNWKTIYREPRTTISNKEHRKYPYLLKDLEITYKNQVWATDITYIPMAKGFMYLCAIIDLHTRFVLNWSVNNTMSAEWCAEVLQETIAKYGTPEIFNTDQGSQYTSEVHTNILLNNSIKISMDGKGRAIDNIFIERLWRTVKYENVYLQGYTDGISLYKGLKEYFEFYDNERFHQSLKYKTLSQMYNNKKVA